MKRIFVDANVINDIYDANRPLHESSYQCLEYCMQEDIELLTSCDLVTTIYYITAKTQGRDKALEALDQIQTVFQLVPFGNRELAAAIALMQANADYHDLDDTVQYVLAKQAECAAILSNDQRSVFKELAVFTSIDFPKSE